jgi:hypothetical protein
VRRLPADVGWVTNPDRWTDDPRFTPFALAFVAIPLSTASLRAHRARALVPSLRSLGFAPGEAIWEAGKLAGYDVLIFTARHQALDRRRPGQQSPSRRNDRQLAARAGGSRGHF